MTALFPNLSLALLTTMNLCIISNVLKAPAGLVLMKQNVVIIFENLFKLGFKQFLLNNLVKRNGKQKNNFMEVRSISGYYP